MDLDCVTLLIAFDVPPEAEGDTPKIIHLEALLLLALELPNQAFISNIKEIIDLPNDCSNDYSLILIVEHKQSTIDA
jgi:hypothetical protein